MEAGQSSETVAVNLFSLDLVFSSIQNRVRVETG